MGAFISKHDLFNQVELFRYGQLRRRHNFTWDIKYKEQIILGSLTSFGNQLVRLWYITETGTKLRSQCEASSIAGYYAELRCATTVYLNAPEQALPSSSVTKSDPRYSVSVGFRLMLWRDWQAFQLGGAGFGENLFAILAQRPLAHPFLRWDISKYLSNGDTSSGKILYLKLKKESIEKRALLTMEIRFHEMMKF